MVKGMPYELAARMTLYRSQKPVIHISAALAFCCSLCAQTGIRPTLEFREDKSAVVTLQELQHVIPRESLAEMDKANRARLKHQPEQVIDHLKRAVLIDPENISARNNLAVCLVESELASAIAQWEEAIKVNPRKGLLFNNLAIGYVLAHNLEAAERAARAAVDLDRTTNRPRAVLGLVLYEEHKYNGETLSLLEHASVEYPMTHVYAAKVLFDQGEYQKARTHARAYLSSGETEHRKAVSEMLDLIDQTPTSEPDQF